MSNSNKEIGALILTIILIVAAAIQISRALFPYVFALTVLALILLVICLIFSAEGELTTLVAGAFVVLLIGTLVFYGIGYGFGESGPGKAITAIADALHIADKAQKDAAITVIDASQKSTLEIIRSTNTTNPPGLEKNLNASYDIMKIAVEAS